MPGGQGQVFEKEPQDLLGAKGQSVGRTINGEWAYLVAQRVKNLPAMWETQVQSLGQEDSLEKGMEPTPVFLPG